jgi:hypothetical protein
MLLQSIARHSLVVSPKALRPNSEGFRSPQATCQSLREPVLATDEDCLWKSLVQVWGMRISAEGLWAIAAAIIIVGIVAVAAVVY